MEIDCGSWGWGRMDCGSRERWDGGRQRGKIEVTVIELIRVKFFKNHSQFLPPVYPEILYWLQRPLSCSTPLGSLNDMISFSYVQLVQLQTLATLIFSKCFLNKINNVFKKIYNYDSIRNWYNIFEKQRRIPNKKY